MKDFNLFIVFIVVDRIYQEKYEIQQSFARQLDELGKTLQSSRNENYAYACLEDAYDEDVQVSKVYFSIIATHTSCNTSERTVQFMVSCSVNSRITIESGVTMP